MKTRLFCTWVLTFALMMPLLAQSNKRIRELERKRNSLQQKIAATESLLNTTRRDVGSLLNNLASLTGQIEEQKRYLQTIGDDVNAIGLEIEQLNEQLLRLQADLTDKQQKYAASVRYLHNNSIEDKLMFIFSAQTLEQTYRRLRYVQEYAQYQKRQGKEIMQRQADTRQKQAELQQAKAAKDSLLQEQVMEQAKLKLQEDTQRELVNDLKKRQQSLQNEIARQRREADQLNANIDRLIARRTKSSNRRSSARSRSSAKSSDAADPLTRSFASNRGKLPAPITGAYLVTSHYGQYNVKGLRGVKLDNKGINLQGRPGAQARAVYRGTVAAVFELNGLFNILIRHGAYISVYCNLSSTSVKQGDEVEMEQPLGRIFSDSTEGNRTELHFQLRKEKEKLNPESWIRRN